MKSFIIKTVGTVGVSLVFKETYIDSYLSYMRLDFVDKRGRYCIFDVFYNETDFFTEDLVLIGEGKELSLSEKLKTRIKVVGSLEDYKSLNYISPTKKDLDKFLSDKMDVVVDEISKIRVSNFSIRKVEFFSNPTLMIFVHFNYKYRRQKPIKVFIGEDLQYKSEIDTSLLLKKIKEVLY